jgi:menaquinol-cytochrome c reductase iron-sulfur subunit
MNESMDRRQFLTRISIGMSGLMAGLIGVPIIGSLFQNFFTEKPSTWRDVGHVNDFSEGETILIKFKRATQHPWAGPTDEIASWLRRKQGKKFIAFSINCTHLGCPVRWVKSSELFLCPCHGGVYYKDGAPAAGPPPASLTRYPVRIKNDRVEVLTSPIPLTNFFGKNFS